MSQKPVYGLIGFPLSHSFSPAYFKEKFETEGIVAEYKLFPIAQVDEVKKVLGQEGLKGLNVTIPYKQSVMPYLTHTDSIAKTIGAVNCIDVKNGETTGYNTDAEGFEQSLKPLLQTHHTRALILGTGGAALAVKYMLEKLDIVYKEVSREKGKADMIYSDIDANIIKEYNIIINTTPIGMYPNTDEMPDIPYNAITEKHLLYDLIYNPEETAFLKEGRLRGATTKNGLEMLKLQAEASWRIWNY